VIPGLVVACGCSCGYALVRGNPASGLRVAPVKNGTAQPEAGGIFAAELRRELSGRGRLEADSSSAPELFAELVALRAYPTGVAGEGAASYRVDADLRVRAPNYEDIITAGEDYLTGVDVLGTEANRRAALRRLARTLAAEAIERYDVSERLSK
jgi:hypothetical protein